MEKSFDFIFKFEMIRQLQINYIIITEKLFNRFMNLYMKKSYYLWVASHEMIVQNFAFLLMLHVT